MTEWHGWIFGREDQEEDLRSLGVTGDINWKLNERKGVWSADEIAVRRDERHSKFWEANDFWYYAAGYFEHCTITSKSIMLSLIDNYPAFLPRTFTAVDENDRQLPREHQTYWSYPNPSIYVFASAFGVSIARPYTKQTPLERCRDVLTLFWEAIKGLPLFIKILCVSAGARITGNTYFKYLVSVCTHKWYVLLECIKLGIPWRGLFHDISKFRPDEFIPYARYFYSDYPSWDDIKHVMPGYTSPTKESVSRAFDYAWLRHIHRNKHHWQHWVLIEDDSEYKTLYRATKHTKEMYADWVGANKAYGTMPLLQWYEDHKHHIRLDAFSKEWIEYKLGLSPMYPLRILVTSTKPSPIRRISIWFKRRKKL